MRIEKVREQKNLREVTIEDCEDGHKGEYICRIEGCNARMCFVPSYERRNKKEVITTASFFRLKPNEKHSYGNCPYDTKGRIEVIARDSESNILKALGNDEYEFSLQILHKSIKSQSKESNNTQDLSHEINYPSKKKTYTPEGRATSYIKTLTQILQLRATLESDEELSSAITLNYCGKKVKWNKFYFEDNQYLEAHKLINGSERSYPVCFHGVISKITQATEKFRYPKLKLYYPYVEPKSEITQVPKVELIIDDRNVDLANFSIGKEILVYGNVKTSIYQKNKTYFLNMDIWINYANQIINLGD